MRVFVDGGLQFLPEQSTTHCGLELQIETPLIHGLENPKHKTPLRERAIDFSTGFVRLTVIRSEPAEDAGFESP